MMNESANLNMPALLPAGPEKMLERARANGLIVPLRGYKVHVLGASPAGSPRYHGTRWGILDAVLPRSRSGTRLVFS